MEDMNLETFTKEIIIARIKATDETLGKFKKFFNEHEGEVITDPETVERIEKLKEMTIEMLKDLHVMKTYIRKVYGITVFTENGF